MEGAGADFHDWEILLAPDDAGDDHPNPSYAAADQADGSEDGDIKSDYFALDSVQPYRKGAAFSDDASAEEEVSDNPSWVDPESNSRYLDRPKDEPGFSEIEFPPKDYGGFWSEESSEGRRSRAGSERGELGDDGGSEVEGLDGPLEKNCKEVGVGELGMIEGRDMRDEDLNPECSNESVKSCEKPDSGVEIGDKNIGFDNISIRNGEKRGMVWWKLPLELLKFCAIRVKPVWSISIAAAVLGVLMLQRRLYSMKQRERSIPLKISLDEKRASQLKVQAARLNEAFSVMRRAPVIRAQLPAGLMVPWPMLSFP